MSSENILLKDKSINKLHTYLYLKKVVNKNIFVSIIELLIIMLE